MISEVSKIGCLCEEPNTLFLRLSIFLTSRESQSLFSKEMDMLHK